MKAQPTPPIWATTATTTGWTMSLQMRITSESTGYENI